MSLFIRCVIFATLVFTTSLQAKVASSLLSAFGGRCPDIVNHSVIDSARGNIYALNNAIETLVEDDDCGTLAWQLNNLNILAAQSSEFEAQRSFHLDKIKNEKLIAMYNMHLNNPGFADWHDSFKDEILHLSASTVENNQDIKFYNSIKNKYGKTANIAVEGLLDFLQNAQATPGCLEQKATTITTLLGQSMSVASAFMAPGSAVAMSAAGVLTQGVRAFIKNYKYARITNELDMAQMGLALECTMNAITNDYCEAKETQTLIEKRISDLTANPRQGITGAGEGIELLANHLEELDTWLTEVYAGSPISSEGDRINREKPKKQKEMLEEIEGKLEAYIETRNDELKTIQDSGGDLRDPLIKSIEALSNTLKGSSGGFSHGGSSSNNITNPITDNNNEKGIVFYLYSNVWKVPSCGSYDCGSLSDYMNQNENLSISKGTWVAAISRAKQLLKKELHVVKKNLDRVRNLSPETTLANAYDPKSKATSPYGALLMIAKNAKRVKDYLNSLEQKYLTSRPDLSLRYRSWKFDVDLTLKTTLKINKMVLQGLDLNNHRVVKLPPECVVDPQGNDDPNSGEEQEYVVSLTPTVNESASQITSCISKILNLTERGTTLYFGHLKRMVRLDLQARLAEGDITDEALEELLAKSRENVVEALLSTYGDSDADTRVRALENAQGINIKTLNTFFKVFDKHIIDALEDRFTSNKTKNRLCVWALTRPSEADRMDLKRDPSLKFFKKVNKLCKNRVVKSIYGHTLEYNKLKNVDYKERVCSFFEYYEKNELYSRRVFPKQK